MRVAQDHRQRIGAAGHGNQMHVVRHQAIPHQRAPVHNGVLTEKTEVHQTIRIGIEDHAPGISALRDMVRHTLGNHPCHSGHRIKIVDARANFLEKRAVCPWDS